MNDFQDKRKIEILAGQCFNASVNIYSQRTANHTVSNVTDEDLKDIFTLAERLLRMATLTGWDKIAERI